MGIHVKDKELLKSLMDKYTIGEIVDEYLEAGKCSSADILDIADDIYNNGENPIEQIDNIMDFERQKALNDPTKSMISLEDMMHDIMFIYYDRDDIIRCFDNDELLDYLENSFELEKYVEDKVDEAINEVKEEYDKEIDELIDAPTNKKGLMKTLRIIDLSPDDIHTIICELTNSNKYERDGSIIIDKLKKLINKNNYEVIYK